MTSRELERLVGAVILPSVRPPGGLAPGAPARRPSRAYLERFPPAGLIGFGRRLPDGATIDGLAAALADVRRDTLEPVFVACDLEQGAGYHLPGATLLPPARALAEAEAVRPGTLFEAGRTTGLEARAHGIELVLAPVLDVNSNPANPIIGARAFGTQPDAVSAAAGAFLAGLASSGAGASVKHFPGHGDTALDSHLALPRIGRSVAELGALELAPFDALLASRPARALGSRLTVMVGHLDVPALTGEPGLPTSLSASVMQKLAATGFDGAVLTDGLEMLAVAAEPELGVRALEAGCHGLLAPADEAELAAELVAAVETGRLAEDTLRQAAAHMQRLGQALLVAAPASTPATQPGLGVEMALAALRAQPGWPALRARLELDSEPGSQIDAVGDPGQLERLGLAAHPGAPRLAIAVPGAPLPAAPSYIWFGPPESRPAPLQAHPHLWAWSPGAATEAAVRQLLAPQELPDSSS